ncbi:hypothetical protein OSTOST_12309 [Ostertagia ostertagi]
MADVKKLCMESLGTVPLGRAPEQVQNGKDFYKFEKLGTGLLLSVHLLANTYDNEMVFRAFCRETIDRHVGRDLDPALWKVCCLESRNKMWSTN